MKRIIAVIVFALISVAFASTSFAKAKYVIPQIASFNGEAISSCGESKEMAASQDDAIRKANNWMRISVSIKILSVNVVGNYIGTGTCGSGFSTVTILYTEK